VIVAAAKKFKSHNPATIVVVGVVTLKYPITLFFPGVASSNVMIVCSLVVGVVSNVP
jgi:hypothetical protein